PEDHVPQLITYALRIVESMTNSPWFPSPSPPLAAGKSAIDALAKAEAVALSRAAGTAATRDERRQDLIKLLEPLKSYVQVVAEANPENAESIIEKAGLSVKGRGGQRGRVFGAKPGRVHGTVILTAPKAGNRAAYEWAYSLDGGTTWIVWAVTTKAATNVTGLTPGAKGLFRYRAETKG